jgi:hypothetical protein
MLTRILAGGIAAALSIAPAASAAEPAPQTAPTQPTHVRDLRGTYAQYTRTPALTVRGSFRSNARSAVVTCTVFQGLRRLGVRRAAVQPRTRARTPFSCGMFRISERLDGRRLRLVVVARSGSQRAVARQFFRAT